MPHTVLSVDADGAVRYLRNEVLRQAGFHVIDAATGTDALKLAFEEQPALAVLAIESSGVDGFAVCKRLKADPRTASIPVLHISCQGESQRDYPESLESGADAYLQEPVEPPVLIAVASALMRARSGGAGTMNTERDDFSRERLAALIDCIPDEVWFVDTQGRFTPAGVREPAKSLEVYRPDGSLRALNGETVRNQEEIVRTPVHGELRYRQVSASPVRDAAGHIAGAVAVVRDITERKQSEQALRAGEERYRHLFETMTEGFALVEIICNEAGKPCDYRYLVVNFAFERHTGLKAEETVGRTVLELFPEAEPVWIERFGKVGLSGEPARFEAWFGPLWRCFVVSAFQTGPGRAGVVFTDITERKRTEEERQRLAGDLADRIGELQAILDDAPVPIWIAHDPQCLRITGNAYADQIIMPTQRGGNISRSARPGDEAVSYKTFRNGVELRPEELPSQIAAATGQPAKQEELDLVFADGRTVHLLLGAVPLFDAAGRVRGSVAAGVNVTRRKRAEQALRESEKVYRAIGESIDYGVWVCAPDGRNTYASESFLKLVGLTQEQCSSFGWGDVLHPEDAEGTIAAWKECVRTEGRWDIEHRFRGVDGKWHPILARGVPVRDEKGRITCWAGINLDISALKRTEESLRASESRERARAAELEAVMDAAPAAIFIAHDAECRYMTGNRMVYALLQRQPGSNLSKSAPESEKPTYYRMMKGGIEIPPEELPVQKAAVTGQPVRDYELELVLEDGTSVNIFGDAVPMVDQDGNSRGAVGVFVDITERKRAEERLREAQKLESLGLLAGGVAHDFNNLLVGVIGNASLALELLSPYHPAADLMGGVIKSGEQAAHLTRQMLAYAGKGKFLVEMLNLSALIPEISGLVQPSISKKISLHLDLAQDLRPIEADRGQMQQVFMNLVMNAAEAIGSDEGVITVRTCVQDVDGRYVRLHPEAAALRPGKYVCLAVRDTGCGMDDATRARIFDPFFSTKFMGRGLGLAAVAGIVRGHQGAILVSSAQGKGSCFTVLLPAAERAAKDPPAAASPAALQGAGVVLVVDDERCVREVAKIALERHGYTVLLADSGLAAIDVFRRHPGDIALVILDLSMPNMSGEEALPELRKIRPGVKVVVSSGYSEAETMTLFKGQPVSGFIQKPYTSTGLAEKVKDNLG